MSRSHKRLGLAPVWAGIVVLFLLPVRAWSETVDGTEVGRVTFGIQFGYGQTRMTRFNENIDVVNHFLTNQGTPLREANRLNGSGIAQGELRYKIGNRFSLGVGVGNAQANSAFNVTFAEVNFFARTTVWSATAYYHLPFVDNIDVIADRVSLYVGGGPLLLTNATAHMRIVDRTIEPAFNVDGDLGEIDGQGSATGSGKGLQGLAGASYQLTSRFSVAAEVGYRYARINNLELESGYKGFERDISKDDPKRREPLDQAVLDFFNRDKRAVGLPDKDIEKRHIPYYNDFNDGPLNLDFSGVQARIGMRLHLF